MTFAPRPAPAHERDGSSRSLHAALLVAVLVHAAVIAVSHRAPHDGSPTPVATVLEYELVTSVAPSNDEPQPSSAEEPRVASIAGVAHVEPGARGVEPGRAGSTTENAVPSTSTSAARVPDLPGDQGTWSLPTTRTAPNLGLNRSAFENGLVRATPEALGAPASSAVQRSVLRTGLSAHDQDVGMARGGIVATAAHDAVFPSLVPDESFALVEVRFDSAGHAVSARVVESQNDRGSWNEAARAMVSQMGDRAVRLPEHAAGLSVFVRIDVTLRLPSGARSAVTQSGSGIAGDLSDIGQSKKRNVAARIVSETVL